MLNILATYMIVQRYKSEKTRKAQDENSNP